MFYVRAQIILIVTTEAFLDNAAPFDQSRYVIYDPRPVQLSLALEHIRDLLAIDLDARIETMLETDTATKPMLLSTSLQDLSYPLQPPIVNR